METLTVLDGWGDFLAAEVGASAALAGLLFVGVSLNLAKILSFPFLPRRAFLALALLLAILVSCSLLLIPGQDGTSAGIALLLVGGAIWIIGSLIELEGWRHRTLSQNSVTFLFNVVLLEAATLPYVVGGILLLAGNDAGLRWFAGAVILSFVKATIDAWVLLVEINR